MTADLGTRRSGISRCSERTGAVVAGFQSGSLDSLGLRGRLACRSGSIDLLADLSGLLDGLRGTGCPADLFFGFCRGGSTSTVTECEHGTLANWGSSSSGGIELMLMASSSVVFCLGTSGFSSRGGVAASGDRQGGISGTSGAANASACFRPPDTCLLVGKGG